jgi:hypothetical protein
MSTFMKLLIAQVSRFKFSLLVPILLLFLLAVFLPPDGIQRAEFPIARLLLVPLVELAEKYKPNQTQEFYVDFILALATIGAIVSAFLGWCLARSDGSSGSILTQHMWGGFSLAVVCWLCWVLRGLAGAERTNLIYACVLVFAVGLVFWTGYRGGQLSQGENHLTEYLPSALRLIPGMSNYHTSEIASSSMTSPGAGIPDSGPATAYSTRIQPILNAHCVVCHGPSKQKAKLRLDSYEALMRGGEHGAVIVPGNSAKSELYRRITLPSTDDDFMPAGNKPPVPSDEIKLIEAWISARASESQPAGALPDLPAKPLSPPGAEVTFQDFDPAAADKLRAPLASAVTQLQQRFPGSISYESRASADLVVDMSPAGVRFGDEEITALKPIAAKVVSADFSGTAITDKSAATIAGMTELRVLRLNRTKITDSTVTALRALRQLESLSLFETAISPAAVPALGRMPRLRHIYTGEIGVQAPD